MRRNLFWLSDEQWKRIEPHLPTDVRGVERADDRRVISGIVQVLKSGCRWCDCPPEYGPPTTIYNRFVRWARRGVWENLFRQLAGNGQSINTQMINSTHSQSPPLGRRDLEPFQTIGRLRTQSITQRFMHSQMLRDEGSSPVLLTGGQSAPIAERLIRRVKPSKCMLGDAAYGAPNRATFWTSAAPIRSFQISGMGNSRSPSTSASTSCAGEWRLRSQQIEGLQAHAQPATTG